MGRESEPPWSDYTCGWISEGKRKDEREKIRLNNVVSYKSTDPTSSTTSMHTHLKKITVWHPILNCIKPVTTRIILKGSSGKTDVRQRRSNIRIATDFSLEII